MISMASTIVLFNFSKQSDLSQWQVVNDGVMGGLSEGQFTLNDEGHGVYTGKVSLANNGGFSSLRFRFQQREIHGFEYIVLRLKGDGKRYQLRLKNDQTQRHSYIQYVETHGEWQTIRLKLVDFYPWFRGVPLRIPNYDGRSIGELAFLIGNKKEEAFELTIDAISLE